MNFCHVCDRNYIHIFVVKQMSKAGIFSSFCSIFKGLHKPVSEYFRPSLCAGVCVLHSVKVKAVSVYAMNAYGGSDGIAPHVLNP